MKYFSYCLLTILLCSTTSLCHAALIFINEIHYDNSGTDRNEFVEVAGSAGINLSGWTLEFYNGGNGTLYKTVNFADIALVDQSNGFGFAAISVAGIQNGAADGIALIDSNNTLVQFLSYEGKLRAKNGTAKNLLSQDIMISENSSTPDNWSLQLTGSGTSYSDFSWIAAESTSGVTNLDQRFRNTTNDPVAMINEPQTTILMTFSALLIFLTRQKSIKIYRLFNNTVNNQ